MDDWNEYPEWRAFAALLAHDWLITTKNGGRELASRFLDVNGKPVMVFLLSKYYQQFGLLPLRVYTLLWERLEQAISGPEDLTEICRMRTFLRENVCDYFLIARNERLMGEYVGFFNRCGFCKETDAICKIKDRDCLFLRDEL